MNELILRINGFKQQLAYDLNNSQLPAEVMKYILQDFVNVCAQMAQAQLAQAQTPEPKESEEDEDHGESNNQC